MQRLPVSHIWYFKGIPSRMGLILDISPRILERVLYFASYIVLDKGETQLEYKQVLSEKEYQDAREKFGSDFRVGMGCIVCYFFGNRSNVCWSGTTAAADNIKKARRCKFFNHGCGFGRCFVVFGGSVCAGSCVSGSCFVFSLSCKRSPFCFVSAQPVKKSNSSTTSVSARAVNRFIVFRPANSAPH